MKRIALLVFASVALCGCLPNGYRSYYQVFPGATPQQIAEAREAPPTGMPLVVHSGRSAKDILQEYAEAGYSPIGWASFRATEGARESGAVSQAKAVGADLVVIANPIYAGTDSSTVPIFIPTTSTTYVSGAFGTAKATTYGGDTNFVNISNAMYDYGAIFMVKMHMLLGVHWRVLDTKERERLQSNKGVVITAVAQGTSAYRHDILTGDIIQEANGMPVYELEELVKLIEANRGKEVKFIILRGDKTLEKIVPIGT